MSDIPEEHVTYWQQRAEEEYPELAGLRRELEESKRREAETSSALIRRQDQLDTAIERVKTLEDALARNGLHMDEDGYLEYAAKGTP